MDKSIIAEALNIVNIVKDGVEKSDMKERLVLYYKRLRKEKGLNNAEEKALHLNIYEKRGITASSIVDYLLDNQLVQENENEFLELTTEGKMLIERLYTNNHSPEYVQFKEDVAEMAAKYSEPTLEEQQSMQLFWRKLTLDYVEECYFKEGSYIEIGHEAYQKETGSIIPEDSMVLHLRPMLYLNWEDCDEEVQLSIDGIEAPITKLDRPYPNKRYVIANMKGVRGKRLKEFGFYTLIQPKESFPKEQTITYRWKVGDDKMIIHHMRIKFQSAFGNLYSTSQRTSRNSDIPRLMVRTCSGTEDLINYCKENDGNVKVVFDIKGQTITIYEKVTLTSIPLKLHYL